VAILKLYRRLRDGIQPELEVTRFLTEKTGFRAAPALLGSAVLRRGDGSEASVAALFERVENRGDAWAVVLDELAADLHGETPAANRFDAGPVLGRRTGEMHAALATRTGDPAFDPEPVDAARLESFVAGARHEMEGSLAVLERVRASLADATGADVDRLLGARARLGAFLDAFRGMEVSSHATRIHGDYHLGQVLVSAAGDVTILDFEGEPGASLEERRAKSSPLRDVAGMLRSFDYAAFAALDRIGGDAAVAFRSAAGAWRDQTGAAFLRAWEAASGIDLGDEANGRLLDLFTLQKALYELRYEAAMRPGWLSIPLRGITALLEKRQVLA
jgi:maltose alpha-D-glucosyltransferase / alpha-amylase